MKILIRGAGDLATGVAMVLKEAGHRIVMTEIAVPLTVRRQVAFSRAVYEGSAVVENVTGRLAAETAQVWEILNKDEIAVLVDPQAKIREEYQPDVIVDAILAKRNLGTHKEDAPCVIALGPGFEGGKDCYAVVETMRGETLGKPIYQGCPIPNTGVPGVVGGYAKERLIKAGADGTMKAAAKIGDVVKKGDILAYTGEEPVYAQIDGIIRGMLQDDVPVVKGMKIGDVDPRLDSSLVYLVSDKSRKIGLGVKEAIRRFYYKDMGIALLAAGQSRRFGSNKLLADINGKPMFSYVTDIMAGFPDCRKVCVTRFPEIREYAKEAGIMAVDNEKPEEGISLSMKLAVWELLRQIKNLKGILFSVCDQPEMKESSIEKMLDLAAHNPGKIICASHKGKRGNPVYWDRRFLKELLELTGDVGGRQLLGKYEKEILLCEVTGIELKDIDKAISE